MENQLINVTIKKKGEVVFDKNALLSDQGTASFVGALPLFSETRNEVIEIWVEPVDQDKEDTKMGDLPMEN